MKNRHAEAHPPPRSSSDRLLKTPPTARISADWQERSILAVRRIQGNLGMEVAGLKIDGVCRELCVRPTARE
jgi:hypothetical protein